MKISNYTCKEIKMYIREFNEIVKRLKESGYDLSKIVIGVVSED